ncbi:restriction endonuclease subunit S [Mycoplasmatota bacterium]|nr:restriction endonuclease subunit S [Mycoplasmatota bacterium]
MNLTTYKLEEIITKIVDNRGRNTDYFDDEKYPVIDNFMIKNQMYPDLSIAKRYLSEQQYDSFLRGYIEKDDLLITLVGNGIGNVTLSPSSECAIVQNTIGLSFDKVMCDKFFMFYYIKAINKSIINLDRGSSQPSVNRKDLLKIKINIPPIEVQREIGKMAIKYDMYIDNNEKEITILEKIAQRLYIEWFVKFKFPGYENTQFRMQDPKGWVLSTTENTHKIPYNWKFDELVNIAEFKRGKNITSSEMIEGDIPVISAGLQPSGYHNEANVFGKNITISASGANAGYLSYHLSDVWAADCSYYQDDKNIWFVYNALKFLQPVISNMQVGSAQPHVYAKNINKLSTIIPPDDLIELYCEKVDPIYEQIRILNLTNENLIKQRDALLTRLISGRLNLEGKEIV